MSVAAPGTAAAAVPAGQRVVKEGWLQKRGRTTIAVFLSFFPSPVLALFFSCPIHFSSIGSAPFSLVSRAGSVWFPLIHLDTHVVLEIGLVDEVQLC